MNTNNANNITAGTKVTHTVLPGVRTVESVYDTPAGLMASLGHDGDFADVVAVSDLTVVQP